MAFACIFVPDFPVEAIVRADPELRDHPVAVLEGKPPLEKVVSVNEEARHEGVHSGMTKLQAELCESVTLRDRSELQESAAHRALLDCALSFSPQVEDVAPDAVLLDLSGLEKLFGTVPKIAWKISQCASAMGLQTNVAVAGTLEAAILAARGFSGTTVVPAGKEAECLGGLRIELLFADESDPEKTEEVLQTFERWGVCRLRELAALPEVELSERLGQWGIELQRRSRGLSHRAFVTSDSPLIFEEVLELEYPLVLLEPLAFALNRMLEQLCARLQARALAAQELHLELMLENGCDYSSSEQSGGVFKRTIHLPIPLLDPKTFLKLLQLDLK